MLLVVLKVSSNDSEFVPILADAGWCSMAMALRRPNMLSYSKWTAESITELQKSNTASDRHLGMWAKLQNIAEDSMTALGLDDYQCRADLRESRIQATLRALDKQLSLWKGESGWENLNRMSNSLIPKGSTSH
jgi:hypothetical protein